MYNSFSLDFTTYFTTYTSRQFFECSRNEREREYVIPWRFVDVEHNTKQRDAVYNFIQFKRVVQRRILERRLIACHA